MSRKRLIFFKAVDAVQSLAYGVLGRETILEIVRRLGVTFEGRDHRKLMVDAQTTIFDHRGQPFGNLSVCALVDGS